MPPNVAGCRRSLGQILGQPLPACRFSLGRRRHQTPVYKGAEQRSPHYMCVRPTGFSSLPFYRLFARVRPGSPRTVSSLVSATLGLGSPLLLSHGFSRVALLPRNARIRGRRCFNRGCQPCLSSQARHRPTRGAYLSDRDAWVSHRAVGGSSTYFGAGSGGYQRQ